MEELLNIFIDELLKIQTPLPIYENNVQQTQYEEEQVPNGYNQKIDDNEAYGNDNLDGDVE